MCTVLVTRFQLLILVWGGFFRIKNNYTNNLYDGTTRILGHSMEILVNILRRLNLH